VLVSVARMATAESVAAMRTGLMVLLT
jgi:hypothetical protein